MTTLTTHGPCPQCGTRIEAIPQAKVGHRCKKRADRWYPLDSQPEGDAAA